MENNKDFLGTQPVGKLLFKLAIPTVIAQLINMLYNIVDRIFIGHIPEKRIQVKAKQSQIICSCVRSTAESSQ